MEPTSSGLLRPYAFGITTLFCKVHLLGAVPHIYPVDFVVIERVAVRVGDEFGMKVASYPFSAYAVHSFDKRMWRFFGTHTGDFFLSPAFEGLDYWLTR